MCNKGQSLNSLENLEKNKANETKKLVLLNNQKDFNALPLLNIICSFTSLPHQRNLSC